MADKTHVFNSYNCKICGARIKFSGELLNFTNWADYVIGEPSITYWEGGYTYLEINGRFENTSNVVITADTYTYPVPSAAWHQYQADVYNRRGRPSAQLSAAGVVKYNGRYSGSASSGGVGIYLPSGHIYVVLTIKVGSHSELICQKRYTNGNYTSIGSPKFKVTVKYQDEDGNSIKDDTFGYVEWEQYFTPSIPSNIGEYKDPKRDDGKNQNDSIGPIYKDETVIVTYEKDRTYYDVKIRYIDNDSGEILKTVTEDNVLEDTMYYPRTNIVYDIKGTFNINGGYELIEDKVSINNDNLTIDTIPEQLLIEGNTEISFYYCKREINYYVRTYLATSVEGKITSIDRIDESSFTAIENKTIKVYAPTRSENYAGYRISKNVKPAMTANVINNGLKNKDYVKFLISSNESYVCVDFVFVKEIELERYSVTINYIDDESCTILKTIVDKDVKEGTLYYPRTKIVYDLKGTFSIDGDYELIEDKVYINNNKTTINTMPTLILAEENIDIDFYYNQKQKDACYYVRTYVATTMNREIIGIELASDILYDDTSNTLIHVDAPEMEEKYLGYRLSKNNRPYMNATTVRNGLTNQNSTDFTINADDIYACVDFVYEYEIPMGEVSVRYVDEDENEIRTPVIDSIPIGEEYIPYVPNVIGDYEYKERNDQKGQYDPIFAPMELTVIYWMRTVEIKVEYIDIITNDKIIPDKRYDIIKGDSFIVDEKEIPTEYEFIKRIGGPGTGKNVGPVYSECIVSLFYFRGSPVVSYPIVSSSDILLGNSFNITIPSNGTHRQMNDIGITQPTDGWNSKYARSEYLLFNCDVIYNNKIYGAGESILIASSANGGLGNQVAKITIPEYVTEGEYELIVIVSNQIEKNKSISRNVGYNVLYDETEATNKVSFRVKGKLYDFTITNLIGDNIWTTSSFKNINGYKASANIGNIAKLPIGQKDYQNTSYRYGIALGSSFFYNMNTIGIKNEKISIIPELIYINEDGVQEDVDIYYRSTSLKYEKIEEKPIELSSKLGSDYYKLRTNLANEISRGLKLYGNTQYSTVNSIGTQSKITLSSNMKVPFVNYFTEEKTSEYESIIRDAGKEGDVLKAVSHWYGRYSLPCTTKVVIKEASVNDSSQEKGSGYIIVLFKILSENGEKVYLMYDNQLVGNQWKNEGGAGNGEQLSINLPQTLTSAGETATITVNNGYYPVAIYGYTPVGSSGRLSYDTAGTH